MTEWHVTCNIYY